MDVKIKNKRFNPYFKEFSGLELGQMREIIAYMFSLMLEKEKHTKSDTDTDRLKRFKLADEITEEDRRYAAEKIKEMQFSANTNNLVDGLSITAEELQDDRTRYILGMKDNINCTHKSTKITISL